MLEFTPRSFHGPCLSTMESKFKVPKGHDGALLSLNAAIDTLDLARDTTGTKSAKNTFVSASVLLTTIRVGFVLVYPD